MAIRRRRVVTPRPPRLEQPRPEPRQARGNDAVVAITVTTVEGTETRYFRAIGWVGDTLTWQRSGKALDALLLPHLQKAFGGEVITE